MVKLLNKNDELVEVQYNEHYDLFKDENYIQSTRSPPWRFNCVAVAHSNERGGVIAVRSSYDDQKRTVFFNHDEWKSFIAGVKDGEFDFGIK